MGKVKKIKKDKFSKASGGYILVGLIIPFSIIGVAGIMPEIGKTATNRDKVNLLFLIVTAVMYLVALILSSKITIINREFKRINEFIDKHKGLTNLEKFVLIDDEIKNNKNEIFRNLYTGYSNYAKSLRGIAIDDLSGELRKRFYSTTDANYFFDEESIIKKNTFYKTINILIQSLTGVGIFGTFLGIVQGLSRLDMSSSNTMKDGVEGLLSGVSVSFNSSLYGILFSVVLTLILKIVIENTMKKCETFGDSLNDIIPASSDTEGLKELEVELKKQSSSLDKLATDLAEQIDKKFDESMQKNLDKLSQDLGEFIEEMGKSFSSSIGENSVTTAIALSNIGPTMERLEQVITNMQTQQEQYSLKFIEESMQAMKETINIGTNKEMDKLKNSMDIISNKNSEMVEVFTSSMENMKMLTIHQENLIKNATDSTQSMNMTTENIKDLQESLSTVIASLKDVSSNNNISLENIQDTIESMKFAMNKQLNINESIENMVEKAFKLSETQQNYILKLDNMTTIIENNMKNTKNHLSNITKEMSVYQNQFSFINKSTIELTNSLDIKYKEIVNDLSMVNENLCNTVGEVDKKLLGKVNEIGNKLNLLVENLNNHQSKTEILTKKIGDFAQVEEATQNLWINYKNSFENLNTTIVDGVENYNKHINEGVSEVLRKFDESISSAVDNLKKVADSIGDTAETVADSLEIGRAHV